jgi:hypothetical protein
MLKDYYFWFAQPSSFLNNYDWMAGYIFAALLALTVIFWLVNKFAVKNPVWKKYIGKLTTAIFWTGLVGMIWFGFRYEAVPLFSKRIIAGVILGLGIIWIGAVKWKFFRNFFREKREYEFNAVKTKYMPKSK